ncbi:hypothetical protein RCL1_006981 [Eukaryota sp. TZLM3-RCL]
MPSSILQATSVNDIVLVANYLKAGSSPLDTDENGNTPLHIACSHADSPELISLLASSTSKLNPKDISNNAGLSPLMLLFSSSKQPSLILDCTKALLTSVSSTFLTKLLVMVDYDGLTPLHYCALNLPFLLDFLISLTPMSFINTSSLDGQTALHYACSSDSPDSSTATELLLKHGADVTRTDSIGRTPLHYAALTCNISTVKLLINHGSSCFSTDDNGDTPLHLCCSVCISEEVISLISKEFSKNKSPPFVNLDGCSPVVYALLRVSGSNCLQSLLSNLTPSLCDKMLLSPLEGQLPLHLAAINSDLRSLKTIISFCKSSCIINYGADCGSGSALHVAVSQSSTPSVIIITTLIEAGFSLFSTDSDGKTVLHLAAQRGCIDVIRCLIDAGAPLSAKDNAGNTPLFYATCSGCLRTIQLCLRDNSDVLLHNSAGDTVLHLAASRSKSVVDLVLPYFSNVNVVNNRNETPLLLACLRGCHETIDLLLRNRGNPLISDSTGISPLHITAMNGNVEASMLLIKFSADIFQKDFKGRTPCSVAKENVKSVFSIKSTEVKDVDQKNRSKRTLFPRLSVTTDSDDVLSRDVSENQSNSSMSDVSNTVFWTVAQNPSISDSARFLSKNELFSGNSSTLRWELARLKTIISDLKGSNSIVSVSNDSQYLTESKFMIDYDFDCARDTTFLESKNRQLEEEIKVLKSQLIVTQIERDEAINELNKLKQTIPNTDHVPLFDRCSSFSSFSPHSPIFPSSPHSARLFMSRSTVDLTLSPRSVKQTSLQFGCSSIERHKRGHLFSNLLQHLEFIANSVFKLSRISLQESKNELIRTNIVLPSSAPDETVDLCEEHCSKLINEIIENLGQKFPKIQNLQNGKNFDSWRTFFLSKTRSQLDSISDGEKLSLVVEALYGLVGELILTKSENTSLTASLFLEQVKRFNMSRSVK